MSPYTLTSHHVLGALHTMDPLLDISHTHTQYTIYIYTHIYYEYIFLECHTSHVSYRQRASEHLLGTIYYTCMLSFNLPGHF